MIASILPCTDRWIFTFSPIYRKNPNLYSTPSQQMLELWLNFVRDLSKFYNFKHPAKIYNNEGMRGCTDPLVECWGHVQWDPSYPRHFALDWISKVLDSSTVEKIFSYWTMSAKVFHNRWKWLFGFMKDSFFLLQWRLTLAHLWISFQNLVAR